MRLGSENNHTRTKFQTGDLFLSTTEKYKSNMLRVFIIMDEVGCQTNRDGVSLELLISDCNPSGRQHVKLTGAVDVDSLEFLSDA